MVRFGPWCRVPAEGSSLTLCSARRYSCSSESPADFRPALCATHEHERSVHRASSVAHHPSRMWGRGVGVGKRGRPAAAAPDGSHMDGQAAAAAPEGGRRAAGSSAATTQNRVRAAQPPSRRECVEGE
jgi:hypothetical protein